MPTNYRRPDPCAWVNAGAAVCFAMRAFGPLPQCCLVCNSQAMSTCGAQRLPTGDRRTPVHGHTLLLPCVLGRETFGPLPEHCVFASTICVQCLQHGHRLYTTCAHCLQTTVSMSTCMHSVNKLCAEMDRYNLLLRGALRTPSSILFLWDYNMCTASTKCARSTPPIHNVYRLHPGQRACAQCLQTVRSVHKLCTASLDCTQANGRRGHGIRRALWGFGWCRPGVPL